MSVMMRDIKMVEIPGFYVNIFSKEGVKCRI
jgi:hypothetical protein